MKFKFSLPILMLLFLFFTSTAQAYKSSESIEHLLYLGDRGKTDIIIAGAILSALSLDNNLFIELGTSVITTQIITEVLKHIVREKRPLGDSNLSFPSGHAAAAFSGATFIYKKFGYRLGIPAFGLASIVAASRVIGKRHYLHDVIVGACLATAMNAVFVSPPSKKVNLFSENFSINNFSLLRLSIQY